MTAHPGARSRGAGQATAPGPGAGTDRGASRSLRGARRPPPRPRRAGWATREAAAPSLTQRGRLGIHGERCHLHGRASSGGHLPGFQKWRKRSSPLRPRGSRGCVTSGYALCGGCGCFRHVGRGQSFLARLASLGFCWGCMAECGPTGSEDGFGHASSLLIRLRLCFIETDSFARLLISVASPVRSLPSAFLSPGTVGLMKLTFSQQLDFCT